MSERAIRLRTLVDGRPVEVSLRVAGDRVEGEWTVEGRQGRVVAEIVHRGDEEAVLLVEGRRRRVVWVRAGDVLWVSVGGTAFVVEPEQEAREATAHGEVEPHAISPMTGTVVKVAAEPGAHVARDDELFVVEAMKMEYVVRAPRDVVVEQVRRRIGDRVQVGEVVVTFAETPS